MTKYCLPIIKETKEEVLSMISENPDYDFYEIWLAYIKDLDTDFVWKLSESYNGKLIFLFRKQYLEKSEIDKQSLTSHKFEDKDLREKIIKLLENSDNLLDLDINDQKEQLSFIKENKLGNKLIVSYHNYNETPKEDELDKIFQSLDSRFRGNDKVVFKVSTFCKLKEDAVKLLTLLLKLKKESKKFLIFGMGEEGKIVRIYGALWGNEFNFAPVDVSEKSAEGQITKERLGKILDLLMTAD